MRILVRVYDYAEIPESTMTRSEAEAARVFVEVGIRMDWISCPTVVSHEDVASICDQFSGSGTVNLRILPRAMSQKLGVGKEDLGFALPAPKSGNASDAWVFFDRAERLAEGRIASLPEILGVAMAHEIGHLLLGPNRHSPHGIMRPHWGRDELQLAAMGQLLYSPEDGLRIRRSVQERLAAAGGN